MEDKIICCNNQCIHSKQDTYTGGILVTQKCCNCGHTKVQIYPVRYDESLTYKFIEPQHGKYKL